MIGASGVAFAAAVTVHLPLLERNRNVIPAECISGAKRDSYLVSGTWIAGSTIGSASRCEARREGVSAPRFRWKSRSASLTTAPKCVIRNIWRSHEHSRTAQSPA